MKILKTRIFTFVVFLVLSFSLIFVSCGNDETSTMPDYTSSNEESSTKESNETNTEENPNMPEESTEKSSETSTDETSSIFEQTSTETSTEQEETSSFEEPVEPEPPILDPDAELKAEVEAILESKHKLTFNDDGTFRILIIADAHMNYLASAKDDVQEVKDRIKLLVDKENPNLVIFTGDNTINSSSETHLRNNLSALVSYIEENKIPWCHVYGNHDHEGALFKVQQQPIHESFEYCISKSGPEEIAGQGNYVHAIYNKDGSIGAVIYLLDSGAYDPKGGYDYIKNNQIEWYKNTSETLQKYNDGKVIPAIMAFHIPLKENNYAYENRNNKDIVYEYTGNKNENICSSNTDTNLFETILERGDVKAIVTGHDHVNDYMYNYYGVMLCSSPNISDLTYHTPSLQGSRVFILNSENPEKITTYVSYLIERLNPFDYEPHSNNTKLETSEEHIITGYNNGALSGTVSLGLSDSGSISVIRSQQGNFEFKTNLTNIGRLGNNKYVVIWMDFSDVDFRKACVGFISSEGVANPYRTDDDDKKTPFYYLADGSDEWKTIYHGTDGCFGTGDSGSQSMKGKKGYFAFPIEHILQGSKSMTFDTLITGFYFYADISSKDYANIPFYIGDIILVEDYKEFNK